MIYSTFVFCDELRMLDLKLKEELPVFDKIIIGESDKTFSNKKKDLHLIDNKKYDHPKIERRFVSGDKFGNDFWTNEKIQRNAVIPDAQCDDDIIFHGDVDWIIHRDDVEKIVQITKEVYISKIVTEMHYYYLNVKDGTNDNLFAIRLDTLKKYFDNSFYAVCKTTISDMRIINMRSKHFGYMGCPERLSKKIKSFSHSELQRPEFTDIERIETRREKLIDPFDRDYDLKKVDIDKTFPVSIQENIDKLGDWII